MSWFQVESKFECSKVYVVEADSSAKAEQIATNQMCEEDAGRLFQGDVDSTVIGTAETENEAWLLE